nr:putative bromo adjacent homology (BAH) domain, zinc finger, RING/FYVE/PHD-type [Tanacetum cinerariifolium]
MHDVEWVGDKLNEADGKTSTGKNLVPGKPQEIWEDSKTNKKWVTVTRYFFPDDLPERVCHPCAPESNEVYESNYQLTLPAGSIHSPCEVLPPEKFSKERAMQSCAQ